MGTEENRWKLPSKYWLLLMFCCVLIFFIDFFQSDYAISPVRLPMQSKEILVLDQSALKDFLVKTRGCRISYMDPFDATIRQFIHTPKPLICNNGTPALVDFNQTSIFLRKASIPFYTNKTRLLKCCYRPFTRLIPKKNEDDNRIKWGKKCIQFQKSAKIKNEFIKTVCVVNTTVVYTDFFSFVPLKKTKPAKKPNQKPNVLVLGIDAVSRLNFHRQMPKFVDYLYNLSAIELLGYNKVGDNTFPNLIPVLTGHSEEELKKICWMTNKAQRFDECPFIWKMFKDQGYTTSYAEDASWMGTFNYQRRGFQKQPTDYMWGVFNRISENEIGNAHDMNVDPCVGSRAVYKLFLDYIENFVSTMDQARLPYFSFNWMASLSHDYLNKPQMGDDSFVELLKNLQEGGLLKNTVVIVMSDHGIRWGDIRTTFQGRMEERLPFIFMVLPEWFQQKYPQAYSNVLKNRRRLTTPFDLHETLKDFLNNSTSLQSDVLEKRPITGKRGYSLFSQISPERTCEDADIASHWCTCQSSFPVAENDSVVVEGAQFVVDHMNNQLVGYRQCVALDLVTISNARLMAHTENITEHKNSVLDYMITLETVPGHGVFEATVRRGKRENETYHFDLIGTISRLNLYGKQSACITDFHLKLYCYCANLL